MYPTCIADSCNVVAETIIDIITSRTSCVRTLCNVVVVVVIIGKRLVPMRKAAERRNAAGCPSPRNGTKFFYVVQQCVVQS